MHAKINTHIQDNGTNTHQSEIVTIKCDIFSDHSLRSWFI